LERSNAAGDRLEDGSPKIALNQHLLKPTKPKKFKVNIKNIQLKKEDDNTTLKI